jgi:RHH-type proline utilization regulon transcriptional repressor/proline dehydrogenase/delta 1-pyrroline-5-carboxylate dehydrogenase
MEERHLDSRIIARGESLLASLEDERPSLFEKGRWIGKIMEWSLRHDDFRTRMLRFVDVFPSLTTRDSLVAHLNEYFDEASGYTPPAVRWGISLSRRGGRLGAAVLSRGVRYSIEKLGRQFIIGETPEEAARNLSGVRRSGCAFSVDILGEAVVSEEEAEKYAQEYMKLIGGLQAARKGWAPLDGNHAPDMLDWGYSPAISISLKPTSLYSQSRPQAVEDSVEAILKRLCPIYERLIQAGGALCIDMESYQYKEISIELFKRLRTLYPDYPHLAIAIQAYLRDSDLDLPALVEWARERGLPITIRLVKGAYWDYEILRARQNGWPLPVYMHKYETDAAFEQLAGLVLKNHDIAYLACGSHNVRSIAAVLELADYLDVPDQRYEFQILYGMAEPIRKALVKTVGRVRLYCPFGRIVPGMAYLVRRLLENTANQSFLRLMFAEGVQAHVLLEDPSLKSDDERGGLPRAIEESEGTGERALAGIRLDAGITGALPQFENQPPADFTRKEERESIVDAIGIIRQNLGFTYPLFIDGEDRVTADVLPSRNPAHEEEIVGLICQADRSDVEKAILAAQSSFERWRETEPRARAEYLLKAAAFVRDRRYELTAWQIVEIGKQWDQASADVAEAIDFLEYYAREMVRIGRPQRLTSPPGEINDYFYEPRGVTAVIAPWNFPLAISTGMVAAAIVTGNCVVFKPSPFTPVIGHHLVDAFRYAGLPHGVFNFVPGRTEVIAEYLTDHPAVATIAFTGSTRVGLSIIEKSAGVASGQAAIKRVISEMGGKNAIVIDDDADLDEAIPAVLVSAFGFQGQKCSACSRVIVVQSIYDTFVARLVEAARSLAVGPAEDPAFTVGPVSDGTAREKIERYIDIAGQEGKILYSGATPNGSNYVPVTIVGDIRPHHRVAQEEIFGPVLAVMKAKDFDEAISWANSTRLALTGGLFSRSPHHLEEARRRFRVGNLYLNRQTTGALVGRQPFGGVGLSGLGTKAGGPDYLLHFMDPRVITENTARRGFAP